MAKYIQDTTWWKNAEKKVDKEMRKRSREKMDKVILDAFGYKKEK